MSTIPFQIVVENTQNYRYILLDAKVFAHSLRSEYKLNFKCFKYFKLVLQTKLEKIPNGRGNSLAGEIGLRGYFPRTTDSECNLRLNRICLHSVVFIKW